MAYSAAWRHGTPARIGRLPRNGGGGAIRESRADDPRRRPLETEIGEAGMVGRPRRAPIPVELAVRRSDRQVVDAGMAEAHQAVLIKLPVLVSVGPEPVAGIVVKLIGETDGDTIFSKGPEFLNKAIIDFPDPFAGQEFDDLRPALKELAPIPPTAVGRVGKRDAFRITTIPVSYTHLRAHET